MAGSVCERGHDPCGAAGRDRRSLSAAQTSQQGQFVYALKGDTAELRPVTSGIEYEGMTVIEKGIADGEQVVTDGQIRLFPGARL